MTPHETSSGIGEPTVEIADRLTSTEVDGVLALVAAATKADDVSPLSEHVLLHLRHGGDDGDRHVRVFLGAHLAGYAHIDLTDSVEGPSAELTVSPLHRRQGVGHLLVTTLTRLSPDGRLRLWAHGGHSDAAYLAHSHGFDRSRELWQMRRSLFAALPTASLPAGISLREFRPGHDDDAWIALNSEAFADLPDQGGWQLEDLHRRIAEPWFDAGGFLIAESNADSTMAGFHWTKVHGSRLASSANGHGHEAIGEVYVIGIAEKWRGTGLGKALLLAGMSHLRDLGLSEVMLYVDSTNTAAIGLYESLGFARWDIDVLFRR